MKITLWGVVLALCLTAAAHAQSNEVSAGEAALNAAFAHLDAGEQGRARGDLNDAERSIGPDSAPILRARLALGWSRYWRWRRSWDRAAEHADDALAAFAEAGADRSVLADTEYHAGYTHYRAGHIATAHDVFERALDLYAEDRELFDPRRLRTNGWATMTGELAARMALDEERDGGGVFVIATHAPAADTELQDTHGAVWAFTDSPGFDVSAWHGRMDGFVVALIDAGPEGEPVNLRILESHPGELWDLELSYALRTWRLDLSDPDARRTDIAVTFIWAVQRHQR